MSTAFEQAREVADAVLYAGYLRHPQLVPTGQYRPQWQFGVLVPPGFAREDEGESSEARTECVLESSDAAGLHVRVRFLHVQQKQVQNVDREPVEAIVVDGQEVRTWEESVEQERSFSLSLGVLLRESRYFPIDVDGAEIAEDIRDSLGRVRGGIVRRRRPLHAGLWVEAERIAGVRGAMRVRAIVRNQTAVPSSNPGDVQVSRHALVAAHLLLGAESGVFVSQVEPPGWARRTVEQCRNVRCWPVLLGGTERSSVVLSAPVILNDNPTVGPKTGPPAPEVTELADFPAVAGEVRLTEEEPRELPYPAGEFLDDLGWARADVLEPPSGVVPSPPASIPARRQPEEQLKIPWWDPESEAAGRVLITGVAVTRGSKVRLIPEQREDPDSDIYLRGSLATVRDVHVDEQRLAVTLDGDATPEHSGEESYRFFGMDEVEPVRPDQETVS
ncbi:hypothetical protein [Parasphingorhabdus pacifica]